MIARRPQSPSSYESSESSDSSESESEAESEAESEKEEEEEKRQLTTRNELLDQLREKERTIKKLQAEVDLLRKMSRTNTKDIRNTMRWSIKRAKLCGHC